MTEAASWDWVEAKESLPARKDGCDLCRRRHKLSNYTRGWRVFLTKNHDNPAAHSTSQASLTCQQMVELGWLMRMKGVKTQPSWKLAGWAIWNEWSYPKDKVGCVWGWLSEVKSWQTPKHMVLNRCCLNYCLGLAGFLRGSEAELRFT